MTNIGSNIKKIRTTKGLSQQAFADLFELTRGNISSYEENRAEPRIATAMKIANYFSIPFDAFVHQNLSINQILNFKGDKLMAEEQSLDALQLKEVPFLNDNIFLQCSSRKLQFNGLNYFPKMVLPINNNVELLAISFNSSIAHSTELPSLEQQDILVFEKLTEDNFHLAENRIGLYLSEQNIMLGNYINEGIQLNLKLNSLKQQKVDLKTEQHFWKLYAIYKHVH